MCIKKKSAIILQGIPQKAFFDLLKKKKAKSVVICEGRPTLEAAQKNAKSLLKERIKPILISDNSAGFLFYKDCVKEIWIAYQLVSRQGALCDVGALILAIMSRKHKIPVRLYPSCRTTKFFGTQKDIVNFKNKRIAPKGIKGFVPLVEWVPAKYITEVVK
ncbi:MAG: hypothetical protein ABIJ41_07610 [Candidatus Omnitrophota bacterium]